MSQPHAYALCFAEELPGPIKAFGHDDAIRPLFPITGPFLFDSTNPYDELETLASIIHSSTKNWPLAEQATILVMPSYTIWNKLQTYQSPTLKPFLP